MYEWHQVRGIRAMRGRSRRDENNSDYVTFCRCRNGSRIFCRLHLSLDGWMAGVFRLDLFLNFASTSLGKLLPRPCHLFQLLTVCWRGRSGQCSAL